MQDVCISFWDEGWTTDMMLKVTDICSTDPSDPTSCGTPGDIKVDRAKIHVWSHGGSTEGNAWPQPAVWYVLLELPTIYSEVMRSRYFLGFSTLPTYLSH